MVTRSTPHPDTLAAYRALGYNSVPKAKVMIRGKALTLNQVLSNSPGLSQLTAMTQDTQARLRAISPLLPTSLRALVQSGGADGDTWCLLVPNSAVAAKLRQTVPALCAHLRVKGWDVKDIHIKVKKHS
jgi:hypothetical protein